MIKLLNLVGTFEWALVHMNFVVEEITILVYVVVLVRHADVVQIEMEEIILRRVVKIFMEIWDYDAFVMVLMDFM